MSEAASERDALALLRDLEWSGTTMPPLDHAGEPDADYACCPACGAERGPAHEPDCRLAAILHGGSAMKGQATERRTCPGCGRYLYEAGIWRILWTDQGGAVYCSVRCFEDAARKACSGVTFDPGRDVEWRVVWRDGRASEPMSCEQARALTAFRSDVRRQKRPVGTECWAPADLADILHGGAE